MQNKLDKDFFKLCFNLPPEEAIKFLEKKDLKVSVDWFDVYREEHVRAFTVAGITKLDVLNDVRDALVEAQKNGETLESFKQNIKLKLRQKGWYGNRLVIRKDGSEKEVNVSSPWRLKTIYRTNMAVAAMTGLYKELKAASDIMPYWRYVTVGDGRVREEHAKIHGKILRHDDPFWDNYFPPNGYNCRCSVEGITETEFKKKGYKLSDGKSMANLVMPFVKTGWDYNPGKEYYTPKPEEYSKELQPIAEKITKEAEKALEKLPEKEDSVTERNSTQPSVLENNFEKSEKSDKINNVEMFHKKDEPDYPFKELSSTAFDNLTIPARLKGAEILRGTDEVIEHLKKRNASASTIGNCLLFGKKVCASEVLEEVRHYEQNLTHMNDDKAEPLRTLLNEIEAKEYVLNNAKKYNIPRNEIEFVTKQLEWYKEQLEEYLDEKE